MASTSSTDDVQTFTHDAFAAADAAFSIDGNHVVAVGKSQCVIWNSQTGQAVTHVEAAALKQPFQILRVGNTNRFLVLQGEDHNELLVWNPVDEAEPTVIAIPPTKRVRVSVSGRYAITKDAAPYDHLPSGTRLWRLPEPDPAATTQPASNAN